MSVSSFSSHPRFVSFLFKVGSVFLRDRPKRQNTFVSARSAGWPFLAYLEKPTPTNTVLPPESLHVLTCP